MFIAKKAIPFYMLERHEKKTWWIIYIFIDFHSELRVQNKGFFLSRGLRGDVSIFTFFPHTFSTPKARQFFSPTRIEERGFGGRAFEWTVFYILYILGSYFYFLACE